MRGIEYGQLLSVLPLQRLLPVGDGHPVLVLPGLLAGDGSTWISIADRLAQPRGVWVPFRPPAVLRPLFPRPDTPPEPKVAAARRMHRSPA